MADSKRDFNADRTICDVASSGPWVVDGNLANQVRQPNVSKRRRITTPPDFDGIADARFIAEARTGWPAALDEIERLTMVNLRLDPKHIGICGIADFDSVTTLQTDLAYARDEIQRLRSVLELMDDRKHQMMPRSQMARLAKAALDFGRDDGGEVE